MSWSYRMWWYRDTQSRWTKDWKQLEESLLLTRVRNGDHSARIALLLAHTPLIRKIARGFSPYWWLTLDDYIQAWTERVLSEIEKFDPTRWSFGTFVNTHAKFWIIQELQLHWRTVRVPDTKINTNKWLVKQTSLVQRWLKLTWKWHTLSQFIKDNWIEVTPTQFELLLAVYEGSVSIHGQTDGDDWALGHEDTLSSGTDTPDVVLAWMYSLWLQSVIISIVNKALQWDPRAKDIILSRFIPDSSTDTIARLQDLATHYCVTPERIRQIEVATLKKLRWILLSHTPWLDEVPLCWQKNLPFISKRGDCIAWTQV